MFEHLNQRAILLLTFAIALSGCATLNPPGVTGPRNQPAYPVIFSKDNLREEATLLALRRLSQRLGSFQPADAKLQPITATIASLPVTSTPLYLPKVGAEPVMNEEETREALRRFIREWQELIGSDPAKLSLVERVDQPDGIKIARYEQRPFRFPIRGNYGKLQIRFTSDRRLLDISSTCIPDADRIQSSFPAPTARQTADQAVAALRQAEIPYVSNGANLIFRVPASMQLTPRELVIYVHTPANQPDALEFHLAWEVELGGAPVKFAYVDAVNGAIVAAV